LQDELFKKFNKIKMKKKNVCAKILDLVCRNSGIKKNLRFGKAEAIANIISYLEKQSEDFGNPAELEYFKSISPAIYLYIDFQK